jgi:hypothetical protein
LSKNDAAGGCSGMMGDVKKQWNLRNDGRSSCCQQHKYAKKDKKKQGLGQEE